MEIYWNFIVGAIVWLVWGSYLVVRICNLKKEIKNNWWELKSNWLIEKLLQKQIKNESPSKKAE